MSRSVYVASPEGLTGKSAVALGLLDALIREVGSVGVFRPLTTLGGSGPDDEVDHIVEMLVAQPGTDQTYEEALGVTYAQAHLDPDEALHLIVERYGRLASRFEVMVVLGSDYTDVSTGTELSFNARVAANLGSPVVLVVHGRDRTPEQVRVAADSALAELKANHASSPTSSRRRARRSPTCRSPSPRRSPRTPSSPPRASAPSPRRPGHDSCSARSRGWTATASAWSSPP